MIRRVGDVWVVFYLGTVGDRLPRFLSMEPERVHKLYDLS
jgi:hypothetical protein